MTAAGTTIHEASLAYSNAQVVEIMSSPLGFHSCVWGLEPRLEATKLRHPSRAKHGKRSSHIIYSNSRL